MEKVNSTDISFDDTLSLLRFKIVFVGDASVGKTSIINQIMDNKFKEDYEVLLINITNYSAIYWS